MLRRPGPAASRSYPLRTACALLLTDAAEVGLWRVGGNYPWRRRVLGTAAVRQCEGFRIAANGSEDTSIACIAPGGAAQAANHGLHNEPKATRHGLAERHVLDAQLQRIGAQESEAATRHRTQRRLPSRAIQPMSVNFDLNRPEVPSCTSVSFS